MADQGVKDLAHALSVIAQYTNNSHEQHTPEVKELLSQISQTLKSSNLPVTDKDIETTTPNSSTLYHNLAYLATRAPTPADTSLLGSFSHILKNNDNSHQSIQDSFYHALTQVNHQERDAIAQLPRDPPETFQHEATQIKARYNQVRCELQEAYGASQTHLTQEVSHHYNHLLQSPSLLPSILQPMVVTVSVPDRFQGKHIINSTDASKSLYRSHQIKNNVSGMPSGLPSLGSTGGQQKKGVASGKRRGATTQDTTAPQKYTHFIQFASTSTPSSTTPAHSPIPASSSFTIHDGYIGDGASRVGNDGDLHTAHGPTTSPESRLAPPPSTRPSSTAMAPKPPQQIGAFPDYIRKRIEASIPSDTGSMASSPSPLFHLRLRLPVPSRFTPLPFPIAVNMGQLSYLYLAKSIQSSSSSSSASSPSGSSDTLSPQKRVLLSNILSQLVRSNQLRSIPLFTPLSHSTAHVDPFGSNPTSRRDTQPSTSFPYLTYGFEDINKDNITNIARHIANSCGLMITSANVPNTKHIVDTPNAPQNNRHISPFPATLQLTSSSTPTDLMQLLQHKLSGGHQNVLDYHYNQTQQGITSSSSSSTKTVDPSVDPSFDYSHLSQLVCAKQSSDTHDGGSSKSGSGSTLTPTGIARAANIEKQYHEKLSNSPGIQDVWGIEYAGAGSFMRIRYTPAAWVSPRNDRPSSTTTKGGRHTSFDDLSEPLHGFSDINITDPVTTTILPMTSAPLPPQQTQSQSTGEYVDQNTTAPLINSYGTNIILKDSIVSPVYESNRPPLMMTSIPSQRTQRYRQQQLSAIGGLTAIGRDPTVDVCVQPVSVLVPTSAPNSVVAGDVLSLTACEGESASQHHQQQNSLVQNVGVEIETQIEEIVDKYVDIPLSAFSSSFPSSSIDYARNVPQPGKLSSDLHHRLVTYIDLIEDVRRRERRHGPSEEESMFDTQHQHETIRSVLDDIQTFLPSPMASALMPLFMLKPASVNPTQYIEALEKHAWSSFLASRTTIVEDVPFDLSSAAIASTLPPTTDISGSDDLFASSFNMKQAAMHRLALQTPFVLDVELHGPIQFRGDAVARCYEHFSHRAVLSKLYAAFYDGDDDDDDDDDIVSDDQDNDVCGDDDRNGNPEHHNEGQKSANNKKGKVITDKAQSNNPEDGTTHGNPDKPTPPPSHCSSDGGDNGDLDPYISSDYEDVLNRLSSLAFRMAKAQIYGVDVDRLSFQLVDSANDTNHQYDKRIVVPLVDGIPQSYPSNDTVRRSSSSLVVDVHSPRSTTNTTPSTQQQQQQRQRQQQQQQQQQNQQKQRGTLFDTLYKGYLQIPSAQQLRNVTSQSLTAGLSAFSSTLQHTIVGLSQHNNNSTHSSGVYPTQYALARRPPQHDNHHDGTLTHRDGLSNLHGSSMGSSFHRSTSGELMQSFIPSFTPTHCLLTTKYMSHQFGYKLIKSLPDVNTAKALPPHYLAHQLVCLAQQASWSFTASPSASPYTMITSLPPLAFLLVNQTQERFFMTNRVYEHYFVACLSCRIPSICPPCAFSCHKSHRQVAWGSLQKARNYVRLAQALTELHHHGFLDVPIQWRWGSSSHCMGLSNTDDENGAGHQTTTTTTIKTTKSKTNNPHLPHSVSSNVLHANPLTVSPSVADVITSSPSRSQLPIYTLSPLALSIYTICQFVFRIPQPFQKALFTSSFPDFTHEARSFALTLPDWVLYDDFNNDVLFHRGCFELRQSEPGSIQFGWIYNQHRESTFDTNDGNDRTAPYPSVVNHEDITLKHPFTDAQYRRRMASTTSDDKGQTTPATSTTPDYHMQRCLCHPASGWPDHLQPWSSDQHRSKPRNGHGKPIYDDQKLLHRKCKLSPYENVTQNFTVELDQSLLAVPENVRTVQRSPRASPSASPSFQAIESEYTLPEAATLSQHLNDVMGDLPMPSLESPHQPQSNQKQQQQREKPTDQGRSMNQSGRQQQVPVKTTKQQQLDVTGTAGNANVHPLTALYPPTTSTAAPSQTGPSTRSLVNSGSRKTITAAPPQQQRQQQQQKIPSDAPMARSPTDLSNPYDDEFEIIEDVVFGAEYDHEEYLGQLLRDDSGYQAQLSYSRPISNTPSPPPASLPTSLSSLQAGMGTQPNQKPQPQSQSQIQQTQQQQQRQQQPKQQPPLSSQPLPQKQQQPLKPQQGHPQQPTQQPPRQRFSQQIRDRIKLLVRDTYNRNIVEKCISEILDLDITFGHIDDLDNAISLAIKHNGDTNRVLDMMFSQQ